MTGVSLRQLQWWDEQGVVSPVQNGRRRLYSPAEVLLVGIIVSLRRKRLSLQKIRKVFSGMQETEELQKLLIAQGQIDVYLLTDGETVTLESSPNAIVGILKRAQKPLLAVSVSDVVNSLGLPRFGSARKPIHTETELAGTASSASRRTA